MKIEPSDAEMVKLYRLHFKQKPLEAIKNYEFAREMDAKVNYPNSWAIQYATKNSFNSPMENYKRMLLRSGIMFVQEKPTPWEKQFFPKVAWRLILLDAYLKERIDTFAGLVNGMYFTETGEAIHIWARTQNEIEQRQAQQSQNPA